MQTTLRQIAQQILENLPKDAFGWVLVVISLVMFSAIYWGRVQWRDVDAYGSIMCLPAICLLGLIFIFLYNFAGQIYTEK